MADKHHAQSGGHRGNTNVRRAASPCSGAPAGPPSPRRAAPILFAILACLSLSACNAGRISAENDRLRRVNLEQSDQIEKLNGQVARLQGQIKSLEAKIASPAAPLPGVKPSDLPVVSAIQFAAFTGALDTDGDGVDDAVRVYLETLDQKGRFLPAVGKAVVQVVAIEAGKPPVELAQKTYDPKAFDEAFVTGLTGTHFTLELKLPSPLPANPSEATVKVFFTDGASGATFSAQAVSKIRSSAAPVERVPKVPN